MYFSTSLLSTIVLAGGALAQYGSSSGYGSDSAYGSGSSGSGSGSSGSGSGGSSAVVSSASITASPFSAGTATASGKVPVQVVMVSNKKGSLTFEPNNFQAAAGSMVQFKFYPKNHSVVRSTFDRPCQPIQLNNASAAGFFSGFMPVKATDAMRPVYTIPINDTKPIWFYCSQGDHCQEGMVGVINPPAANKSRTIDSFKTLASKAMENLSPGQSPGSGSSGNSDSTGSASSGYSAPSSGASSGASGSGSSGSVTMPLSGTNSSSATTAAASPSGSAGGKAPQSFTPGSGANVFASRMDILSSLGLAGLVGFIVVGVW